MLRMLARREYFRDELAARMRTKPDVDEGTLQSLLDEFVQQGWLCDERAARVAVRADKSRYGDFRLRRDLIARGAGPDVAAVALAALGEGGPENDEAVRALTVLRKRYASAPVDARERARQARFLAGRGFGGAVIKAIIGVEDETEQM